MRAKHVVIVGYDKVTSLDLSGPLDAFSAAFDEDANGNPQRCYRVTIAAVGSKTFSSNSGLRMTANCFLSSLRDIDTLLIPGGHIGFSSAPKLANWISRRATGIRRIASVCTGVFALAPTGLLDGRRVTTHWRFAVELANRFPSLKVDANALYIRDGSFYTSAGVTAGIDLSLALIEEDFGPRVALAVARNLVVYMKRPGGQEQFSEPLKFQTTATSRFADLAAWMRGRLNSDLSVESMAEHMNLCTRQFSRRFRLEFNSSPAAFVQRLRLDEARQRLSDPGLTVRRVAESVGFHDPDSFRRAFMNRFGVPPTHYRRRFVAGKLSSLD
ncbi:MAG TPA: GlxA family transcriptional regulator [Candidatus Aquilonibacter sp.]|nr:GlxA family transcriptional regulator [Candidatus Aquilonibacter sp.]